MWAAVIAATFERLLERTCSSSFSMPVPIGITARLICDESRMSGWSSDLSHRMLAAAVGGQRVVVFKKEAGGSVGEVDLEPVDDCGLPEDWQ